MRNLDSSFCSQKFSSITQQKAVPFHVSVGKFPALPQSGEGPVRYGNIPFLLFKVSLSFEIKANVGWNGDRALRDLYSLLESDAFPQSLNMVRIRSSKFFARLFPPWFI